MNLIRTNTSFSPGYSSPEFYYQRAVDSKNQLGTDKNILKGNLNSEIYINAKAISNSLRISTIINHNINNAIGLIQSIVSAAVIIENKLGDMKAVVKKNDRAASQDIKEIENSLIGIANDFSWNGIRYMASDEGGNQGIAPRKLIIKTGLEATSDFHMSFKSFNPKSAIGTEQSLELATWNHINISKLHDSDTHAYGSGVLYSSLSYASHLHTHTRAMRDQTIIQISRAIDGIKREKIRLEGYLRQLNDISENNQSESLNKSNYVNQSVGVKQAYEIAISLESEFPKNWDKDIFPREKINISTLNELLH